MTSLPVGDHYYATELVYNDSGALTDATVALTVTDPSGNTTTPSVNHASTGTYTSTFTLTAAGVWYGTWAVSGAVVKVDEFQVTAVAFPPGPTAYVTRELLKQALNIPASDTTRDALVDSCRFAAARMVEENCDNRVFTLDATTSQRTWETRGNVLRADRWGGEKFYVDDFGSATGVVVETSDDEVTWTSQSPFDVWPFNAVAKLKPFTAVILPWPSCVLRTTRLIRVTARWGWPQVPSQVEQANLLQAMRLYRRPSSPEGVAGSPDWGLVRIPYMDPDVKALLAPFTMPVKVG